MQFIVGTDKSSNTTLSKNGVSISITDGKLNRDDNYRLYANATMNIKVDAGKNITKIEFTSTASGTSNYGPSKLSLQGEVGKSSYSGKVTTWTGSSNSVSYKATAQYRFTKIVVTYE